MKFLQYDDKTASIFGSCTILLAVIVIFLFVSEVIGQVGRTVMFGGFFHVRRHGLMGYLVVDSYFLHVFLLIF